MMKLIFTSPSDTHASVREEDNKLIFTFEIKKSFCPDRDYDSWKNKMIRYSFCEMTGSNKTGFEKVVEDEFFGIGRKIEAFVLTRDMPMEMPEIYHEVRYFMFFLESECEKLFWTSMIYDLKIDDFEKN